MGPGQPTRRTTERSLTRLRAQVPPAPREIVPTIVAYAFHAGLVLTALIVIVAARW